MAKNAIRKTKPVLQKHSISIRGHRTSFSLEDEFWKVFKQIASEKGVSRAQLITRIDHDRDSDTNLSSAIRLYVLQHLQSKVG